MGENSAPDDDLEKASFYRAQLPEDTHLDAYTLLRLKEILHDFVELWKSGTREKQFPILFYGPSKISKTQAAIWLSKNLTMELFRVDLTGLLSKYIGETEKNLKRLFANAEDKEWILFFDEADALFGKRTEIATAHDRYTQSEWDLLLEKIVNFEGLIMVSCKTADPNDPVFHRRFRQLIHFPFPS